MLAGRPHEAVGNGSPRWMTAAPRERGHRTRPTGRRTPTLALSCDDAAGEPALDQAKAGVAGQVLAWCPCKLTRPPGGQGRWRAEVRQHGRWWRRYTGMTIGRSGHELPCRHRHPHQSVAIQLAAQEAKAWARIGDRRNTEVALDKGRRLLEAMPYPDNLDHHFVVDPTKLDFYMMDCYRHLAEDRLAEALATSRAN